MNKYLTAIIVVPLAFGQTVLAQQDNRGAGREQPFFLKLFDENGDGRVTEAEFTTAMERRYGEMDSDKDGQVSIDEFKNYTAERHKKWQHKKHGKMDTNGDGAVSKQEYIDRAVKRAERRFDKLDVNGDGRLDAEEGAQQNMKKKQKLLERMDRDKDGRISREEHEAMARRWFEKLDADNDGVVVGDELKGFHGRRH